MEAISVFARGQPALSVVLADIDDTMTSEGKLSADAYSALWALYDAGIAVVPVTGRPAGWCDLIVRQWPVSAVIGENGAFAYYLDNGHREVMYHPNADLDLSRLRLPQLERSVLEEVPGARVASDQFSRLFDLAIDFREDPPRLGMDQAVKIQGTCERHGAHAKISSIHVNAWYGDYDKRSMATLLLQHRFGLNTANPADNARAAYCGDSPNDEPMFELFTNACAVANVRETLHLIEIKPRYVTERPYGTGFAEFAHAAIQRCV